MAKMVLNNDYDMEGDALHIDFGKPEPADDSIIEDDVIVRLSDGKIVGITILSPQKRLAKPIIEIEDLNDFISEMKRLGVSEVYLADRYDHTPGRG